MGGILQITSNVNTDFHERRVTKLYRQLAAVHHTSLVQKYQTHDKNTMEPGGRHCGQSYKG